MVCSSFTAATRSLFILGQWLLKDDDMNPIFDFLSPRQYMSQGVTVL